MQPQHSTRPALGSTALQRASLIIVRAEPEDDRKVVYNKEFGYSRKDVLVIIVALIALGIFMYEGLQAAGMSPGMAGNWVQLLIFLGICVGWVSTYLYRVANKVTSTTSSCKPGAKADTLPETMPSICTICIAQ